MTGTRRAASTLSILHLIPSLGTGGAERSLVEMIPVLEGAGISSSVVCFFRTEGVEGVVREAGIRVRFISAKSWWGRVLELHALLKDERPDVLHTVLFEADVVGRIAAVRTGALVLTSLVSTPYEPVRLQDPNIRWSRLTGARLLDGMTARHLTTHFHAITGAVKESAIRHLKLAPDRITVAERGRDPGRLGEPSATRCARARRSLGIADDEMLVVNVGRQEFAKGQRLLVEAFARIQNAFPRARLLIAGPEGRASTDLRHAIQTNAVEDRVTLLGNRKDVPELMAAADVFAFPSLYEGLGGAVIEAMALGLPVVASDLPPIRETVEDGRSALLASPNSPEALANAIGTLLESRGLRESFGRRGREIFEERFTLERAARRMLELYWAIARHPLSPQQVEG